MHAPEKISWNKGNKYEENKSRTTSVCFQCKFETVKTAVMEKSILLIVLQSSFLGESMDMWLQGTIEAWNSSHVLRLTLSWDDATSKCPDHYTLCNGSGPELLLQM